MSKSRGQLITEKYIELQGQLKKFIDVSLFPPLETLDLADIVVYLLMIFTGITEEHAYRVKIQELMKMKGVQVDEATFEKILPIIVLFIEWMKGLN